MLVLSTLVSLAAFMFAHEAAAFPSALETRDVGPQLASLSFYSSCKNYNQTGVVEREVQVFNSTYIVCHTTPFNGLVVHDMDSHSGNVLNQCKVDVWKTPECQDGGDPKNFLGGFKYNPSKPDPCVDTIGGSSWHLDCPFPVTS